MKVSNPSPSLRFTGSAPIALAMLALVFVFGGTAPRLPAQEIPAGGESLVSLPDIATQGSFYANQNGDGPVATRTVVSVEGPGFDQAARINTARPTGLFYSSAVTAAANRPLADGDVVLLHFFMRAIETSDESGTVVLQAYFEGPGPGYTKSLSRRTTATSEWTEYFLPFEIEGNYGLGSAAMKFGVGGALRPQVLEFGGVELLWYGTSRSVDELPRTGFSYIGREADAPWRAEAAARIEQHRKADFALNIVDANGEPLRGAQVRVRQQSHAFDFGTAMVASRIMSDSPDNTIYKEKILELFNAGTFENDTKWPPWIGEWGASFNQQQTLAAGAWTQARNLRMRGHVLVWPSTRNMPDAFEDQINAADPAIPGIILDHIDDVMQPTNPFFEEWDVINEPYDNFDIMRTYGDEHMIDWFQRARENHATAELYINDYSIIAGGGLNVAKQDAYAETIQYLIDGGAPITGIGFQGHFSGSPTGMPRILEILQRYTTEFPGLKMRITELDMTTDDEELQADFYRDFITLAMSHPQMDGVQFWGFWEGSHWRPSSALYREDWSEKPAVAAYRQLVLRDWWTDNADLTPATGTIAGRGFHGEYVFDVVYGDHTISGSFDLTSAGVNTTVAVDVAPSAEPSFIRQPLGRTVLPGEDVTLTAVAAGFPVPTITWHRDGAALGVTGETLVLPAVGANDDAYYQAIASNDLGTAETRRIRVAVRTAGPSREELANISTRGHVDTGSEVLVAGFVIDGDSDKDVVIRAVGPRLQEFGLAEVLADPQIEIYRSGESTPMLSNDDWSPDLAAIFTELGAFELADDEKSAAVRATLSPGAYTALVSGVDDGTGIALVEVYDAQTGSPTRMANISTRGMVGVDAAALVAGFVIEGEIPQPVLIRGIGPTLADFGVADALEDPFLRLYERLPDGTTRFVMANNRWGFGNTDEIAATTARVGGFPLRAGSADACLLVSLEPGAYTVNLSGVGDGTGIALVEVYRIP